MKKKLCLITGANSGIGKAAAKQISAEGFHVLVGSRNEARGKAAVAEISESSGNKDVDLLLLDLSSKASIEAAAKEVRDKYGRLDVLIHNAADFDISRKEPQLSKDGIEMVWATNHIGPVRLTSLLIDLLRASSNGRIITVASKGLIMHKGMVINHEDPEFKNSKYSVSKAYYQSKLAQVMYTYWLAEQEKETNVTANCIRVTNVKVDISRYPDLSPLSKFLYRLKSLASLSPEVMARTYTLLATDENLGQVSGKYFDEKNRIVKSSAYSRDKQNIDALMELTKTYL